MSKVAPIRRYLPQDAWIRDPDNYIVIVGCSRLSVRIARQYQQEGRRFIIVNEEEPLLSILPSSLNDNLLVGDPTNDEVLKEAGIETATALLALSDNESLNIIMGLIARKIYNIPKVIIKVYDDSKAALYAGTGVDTISPVDLAAQAIDSLITKSAE